MTVQTTSAHAFEVISHRIRDVGTMLATLASDAWTAALCARRVESLLRLSDTELARRGLTRDAIVRHVFDTMMSPRPTH